MNNNNGLAEAIPTGARKSIYLAYGIVGAVIGSCQVGFSAADIHQPVWLTVALAVFAYLGIALGVTAFSNTPGKEATATTEEAEAVEVDPERPDYAPAEPVSEAPSFERPLNADQATTAPAAQTTPV